MKHERSQQKALGDHSNSQQESSGKTLPAVPVYQKQSLELKNPPVQTKMPAQLVPDLDEEKKDLTQLKPFKLPAQLKANNTGLPDNLKSAMENKSGFSMDDVKVHYNSDKPAQLQALAYAQGSDIHIAPGQEKHLPHEAWHVVQQKQGRVQPTVQMKQGVVVNDDRGLEAEADKMGDDAMRYTQSSAPASNNVLKVAKTTSFSAIQRKTEVNYKTQKVSYTDAQGNSHDEEVGYQADAWIDITDHVMGAEPDSSTQQKEMYDRLAAAHGIRYFIRGHLLNGNIGGVGAVYNLFPITSHANGQHKITAEGHLKNHVRAEQKAFKKNLNKPYFVRYRVTAIAEDSNDMSKNANAKFFCEMVSAHSGLPGGENEVWTIYSKPNNKPEAEGDKATKYDYSNQDLGNFTSSGKGESMDTRTSRERSTVNGWRGNQQDEFTPGAKGANVTNHVQLSAMKDNLLTKLENEIDKHPLCEDILFDKLEELEGLLANAHDITTTNQAYNDVWTKVLLYEKDQELKLSKKKDEFLNNLGIYLTGINISNDAKNYIYTSVLQFIRPIPTIDTFEQKLKEIINSINFEVQKHTQH